MSYYTISKVSSAQFADKGSKFIAYVHPLDSVDSFKNIISNYKNDNPKSSHVCNAYRIHIGTEIVDYSSDDGEPRGSAGQPILNVLKRKSLVNVAAYVVRYFGGTKLGIPGLINAYEVSTIKALDNLDYIDWEPHEKFEIVYPYEQGGIAEHVLEKYRAIIIEQFFSDSVRQVVAVPTVHVRTFKDELVDRLSGKIDIKKNK